MSLAVLAFAALLLDAKPVLRVVYFVPTDRQGEPDHVERLDRVMTEVQRFYREGMKQNGHGPLTFELERDAQGKLKVHQVQAKEAMRAYGRSASDKVRNEVKAALATDGLNIDRETTIIFQLLLDWQGAKAEEIGPYVGGGDARAGTAWVYDDAKLDPKLLPSKAPGGWYNGPCSLGQFNTHYLGGVAHELGHALGLPHEKERDGERAQKGSSLMGAGNHTYGQEQRNEGRGTFLTAAAALPLSVHPLFTAKSRPTEPMALRLHELTAGSEKNRVKLTGRLQGGPKPIGIIAYNDHRDIQGDYDSTSWTSPVDESGRFSLVIEDLRPGHYDLRLRAIGFNGDTRYFGYHYQVDANGLADVTPLLVSPLLHEAQAVFRARDQEKLAELVAQLKKQAPPNPELVRKGEHLLALLSQRELINLKDVPVSTKSVKVADLKLEAQAVGWGQPLRNQVLPDGDATCLLEVAGKFFPSGFYAHAPSRYAVRLDKGWQTFATKYGLQDNRRGSVVFVIKGDGKELFRSKPVRDHKLYEATVSVVGVNLLELVVEDAGDGGNSDWGVWLESELKR
jgi:hypothetical protein